MSAASPGAAAIVRERARQVDFEGWTPKHDAHHRHGELVAAASSYLRAGRLAGEEGEGAAAGPR
jgi:hypothetical protein